MYIQHSYIEFHYWREVHGIVLTVGWFALENVGLWILYLKEKSYAVPIHIFCMSCVGFLMAIGPIMEIVIHGPSIITQGIFHQLWGFILFCVLPFLLLSGAVCILAKGAPKVQPELVYFLNKTHTIIGWIYIILVKVPLLNGWYGRSQTGYFMFYVILAVSIPSYSLYLYLKFFRKKIQGVSIDQKNLNYQLRAVKSSKGLEIYSNNFFIFANYIYSLSPILGMHPGGWKIIEEIRGREVDRFLYGVDPIQLFNVSRVSHTSNSIEMAGQPIAILKVPQTYIQMLPLNKARLSKAACHDQQRNIHTLYFQFENSVCFNGYSDLAQIGQYFAVTIGNKLTRLYTAVNFLQPSNVNLIVSISGGKVKIESKVLDIWKKKQNKDLQQTIREELVESDYGKNKKNILPLLIKKYNDGIFTSKFLDFSNKTNFQAEILISEPRGLGLSLDTCSFSNIILLAGGTGLYPFCDFIDLLFKEMLIEQNNKKSTSIQQSDPLLKSRPFSKMNISLYLAVNELSELHPITLYQCNELSKTKSFKTYAKIKQTNLQRFTSEYDKIKIHKDRFEGIIKKQIQQNLDSYFFICGPVRFTRGLVEELRKQEIGTNQYRII